MEDFEKWVSMCPHSGTLNIPMSLENILEEGMSYGFTANPWKDIFLKFISK